MNKRTAIAGFLLTIIMGVTACAATPESTVDDTTGLTFIHLNDTYRVGAVEDGTRGGFGRVVTLIRELQAEGREVRITHGGDFLYPSLESQLWNGLQMVDAMNYLDALAPMYVTLGNHEFDRRTPESLVNAVNASTFEWVSDNVVFRTGDAAADAALRSAFVFEAAGRTIGVFSVTLHANDGGNDRDYVPTDPDYLGVAERTIEVLEQSNVDAIIGVTHVHLWTDAELAKLKARFPKLAFIVGGHEHEPQFVPGSETQAPVMKGASNARVIWRIDLTFDETGLPVVETDVIELGVGIAPDPDYALLDQKWRDRLLEKFPFLEARVGTAAFPMDATEETVRTREAAWANFIVDQMPGAFGEPAADFAFINSGSLRIDDYVVGDISFEDIARTFGFSSFLRYVTVTGAEFRQLMEAGFRGDGTSQGYFPQISGFRLCVDRSRESLSRIVSLQVPGDDGWGEIDPEREYTLVLPDFLYRGGDGYRLPESRQGSRTGAELKYLVLDAILRAQGEGQPVGVPLNPKSPRIELHAGPNAQCFAG
ncbi:MAG: 5'-nucleotidase C-terminal domain-containing protein [Gammaproteobacteria bacterium]|nr:5'-nucleotidase C-terminal domain-containing protein [Gammaproteobacteria bacterium]